MPIAAPLNLVATPVSSTRIDLTWTQVDGSPIADKIIQGEYATENTFALPTLFATTDSTVTTKSLTGLVPGTTYYFRIRVEANASSETPTFGTWSATATATTQTAAWYYSNRAGVLTVIDPETARVTWDMDNDGVEDAGLMTTDGITADGYIDLFLADKGLTVPVVLSGAGAAASYIVTALADVSNHLTVWYGWTHRGLQELSTGTGKTADDIAGLMSGYKTYADSQLARIAGILLGAEGVTEGTFESVDLVDSTELLCDENGCGV